MATTRGVFEFSTLTHDGGWGTNVNDFAPVVSGTNDDRPFVNFGTSTAQQSLVVIPDNSTSTTTSTDANRKAYGWALNAASGVDEKGMGSTASAKRTIAAGVWVFTVYATPLVAQSGSGNDHTRLTVYVYRVAANGTRTELFNASSGNDVLTSAQYIGCSSASQPKFTFEAGETFMTSWVVTSAGKAVTGQTIRIESPIHSPYVAVELPSPSIRTTYIESAVSATGVGAASVSTNDLVTVGATAVGVAEGADSFVPRRLGGPTRSAPIFVPKRGIQGRGAMRTDLFITALPSPVPVFVGSGRLRSAATVAVESAMSATGRCRSAAALVIRQFRLGARFMSKAAAAVTARFRHHGDDPDMWLVLDLPELS